MSHRVPRSAPDGQSRKSPRLDFAAVIQANVAHRPDSPAVFADWAHI